MTVDIGRQDLIAVLPALAPALGGILILLQDALWPMRSKLLSAWIALGSLAYAGLTACGRISESVMYSAFLGTVRMDAFSHYAAILVTTAAALAVLASPKYLRLRRVHFAEYYALMLFSCSGMIFLAAAEELMVLFLAIETLSIPLYCLAAFTRTSPYSVEGGMKYFVLGAFATGFLVYGIALIFGAAGTGALRELSRGAVEHPRLYLAGMTLMSLGFLFKIAAAPFHMWAPDAYEGAPPPVALFFAAGVKAAAFGGLLKLFVAGFGFPSGGLTLPVLTCFAVLTMTVGNLIALVQESVKRMLAYSSVAHAGYLLVGLAACSASGTLEPVRSILYYLAVYILMTGGAFGVLILFAGRERDTADYADLTGLARERPWAAALMALFMLSLAGVPPLAGFFGKLYVFADAVRAGLTGLVVIAMLNSAVSLYYYLRVVVYMYMQEPLDTQSKPVFHYEGYGLFLLIMLAGSAVALVSAGIFPAHLLEHAAAAALALSR